MHAILINEKFGRQVEVSCVLSMCATMHCLAYTYVHVAAYLYSIIPTRMMYNLMHKNYLLDTLVE